MDGLNGAGLAVIKITNLEVSSSILSNALCFVPYTSRSSYSGNVGFSSIRAHVQVAAIKYINKPKLSHENELSKLCSVLSQN